MLLQRLSFQQTQKFYLSATQTVVLRKFEKALIEKIHGPNIKVVKIPIPSSENFALKCYPGDSNEGSTFNINILNKEEVDNEIAKLSQSVTAISLYTNDARLYINIIHYYQTLSNAFTQNGRVFSNIALEEWQKTIVEFLGTLPDTWIAKIVSRSAATIGYYRMKLGIDSCSENLQSLKDEGALQEEILKIQAMNLEKLREFQVTHVQKTFSSTVKDEIIEYIKLNKDKTDVLIQEELCEKGINLARRTVGKYRAKIFAGVIVPDLPIN